MNEQKFRSIIDKLKRNDSSLIDLQLRDLTYEQIEELSEILEANNTITTLVLIDTYLGIIEAQILAESLKKNNTITELALHNNTMGEVEIGVLAKILETNNTIVKISLSQNHIGNVGAQKLAESLKKNNAITDLNLHANKIGNDGAKALAKSFEKNNSIIHVALMVNEIEDDGAKALAKSFEKNNTITHVALMGNKIGDDGAKALAESLIKRPVLFKIIGLSNQVIETATNICKARIDEAIKKTMDVLFPDLSDNSDSNAKLKKSKLNKDVVDKEASKTINNISTKEYFLLNKNKEYVNNKLKETHKEFKEFLVLELWKALDDHAIHHYFSMKGIRKEFEQKNQVTVFNEDSILYKLPTNLITIINPYLLSELTPKIINTGCDNAELISSESDIKVNTSLIGNCGEDS